MDRRKAIQNLGEALLTRNPDCIPRFRIIRDILEIPATDPMFIEARGSLAGSMQVMEVIKSQESDGTWGRFHSQDSKDRSKRRFLTTEQAIRQALALGFDKDDMVLKKAAHFMVDVLAGKETWTDPPEKHEGWPTGVRLITAATLARVDKAHPAIRKVRELWADILKKTFASGQYDSENERKAHQELNGIFTKGKYPKLASIYPLILLSSADSALPKELEAHFLDWIWRKQEGIYYLTWFSMAKRPDPNVKAFPFWIEAVEILSGFERWVMEHGEEISEWLWNLRNSHEMWDLTATSESSRAARQYCCFQLSESWKNPWSRGIDCSVRALSLMKKLLK